MDFQQYLAQLEARSHFSVTEKIVKGFCIWWKEDAVDHRVSLLTADAKRYFPDIPAVFVRYITEALALLQEARLGLYFEMRMQAKLLAYQQLPENATEEDILALVTITRLMDYYRQGLSSQMAAIRDFILSFSYGWAQDYTRHYFPQMWADD